ncbi:phosphatase PAP2 family protein [Neobittarella massiliensis]|uniref:Phosphatase PAP2 family protein n=1 Tax=Neobittarella massiliensis (ex Bilen et al. 2018) TaxID=2041842 RepID=A0A8J6INN5_9FIRM|nr:phosphatase PAP2 family protein [Neobittarella massiliensis]MBC3515048.1 phosphatase PAP2 family protein [Neobittarella massiliensis]
MLRKKLYHYDVAILYFIQEKCRRPIWTPLMVGASMLGNGGLLWLGVSAALLAIPGWRRVGYTILAALVLGLLIGNVAIKLAVGRTRPYVALARKVLHIAPPQDSSFPSCHTLSSFAAATVLFMADYRLGLIAGAVAAVIAFSRLYLFVHYPSDVLAGLVLGIGVAVLTVLLLQAYVWHGHGFMGFYRLVP